MSSRNRDVPAKEIPDVVINPSTKKRYMKGRFLGKGGFAKCYELTDVDTKETYAGKIVPKSLLVKPHQKEKMTMEISIHRSLHHHHVVNFHSFFEDSDFVYVLLELCRRRSLMELHKRRKAVTEPEARYYMHQMVLATQYLHGRKVIHRDLKLGNLFINDQMDLKVGDFGLATRIDYSGERKRTLCGTPNYIAPEVLGKKGHSYEVDMWSLGCILYTLLVGKPPFETTNLKDTYMRIKKNEYYVPSKVSAPARGLIRKLLQDDPSRRPSIHHILQEEFFTSGYLPPRLPTSCLTTAPRFNTAMAAAPAASVASLPAARKPLLEINSKEEQPHAVGAIRKKDSSNDKMKLGNDDMMVKAAPNPEEGEAELGNNHLADMFSQLADVLASKPSERAVIQIDEAEDPAAVPIYWVSKWVDYSDKYGLGYQLCDNSVGVLFNDSTRLVLCTDGESIQYIEKDGQEVYHSLRKFPQPLSKKVTLLKYFRNYMSEHLLKAGAAMTPREGDDLARLPFLRAWFRTRSAIVLHLSNGTLQINFFQDHTKIILCPLMQAVTYIDENREFRTYRLGQIKQYGCGRELTSRLRYTQTMVERLQHSRSSSAAAKSVKSL